jgi:hypothetical protein
MQNLMGKHGRRTPALSRMMWEGNIKVVYRAGGVAGWGLGVVRLPPAT